MYNLSELFSIMTLDMNDSDSSNDEFGKEDITTVNNSDKTKKEKNTSFVTPNPTFIMVRLITQGHCWS